MKNHLKRFQSVQPLGGVALKVRYTGRQAVRMDFSELAENFAVFAPLRQPGVFASVRIAD